MKNRDYTPGIILIGLGTFFLLRNFRKIPFCIRRHLDSLFCDYHYLRNHGGAGNLFSNGTIIIWKEIFLTNHKAC